MARDTLSVQKLTRNGATVSTGQTINPSNGIVIPAAGNTRNLWFEVRNTNGTIGTVTVKAGDNPPSPLAADLDIALTGSGGATPAKIIGPFESARFMQSDGSVNIAVLAASSTPSVTVRAYRLPKT